MPGRVIFQQNLYLIAVRGESILLANLGLAKGVLPVAWSRPSFHLASSDRLSPCQFPLKGSPPSGAIRTKIALHASGALNLLFICTVRGGYQPWNQPTKINQPNPAQRREKNLLVVFSLFSVQLPTSTAQGGGGCGIVRSLRLLLQDVAFSLLEFVFIRFYFVTIIVPSQPHTLDFAQSYRALTHSMVAAKNCVFAEPCEVEDTCGVVLHVYRLAISTSILLARTMSQNAFPMFEIMPTMARISSFLAKKCAQVWG